jgi:hypothetical protein
MPTQWQTFPVEFKGGLITNISPLQQGIQSPGSARVLKNFEPSVEGGYRRIEGFNKFNSTYVQPYGVPKVQGSGQTGTTLVVANLFAEPQDGDTFTIDGDATTYTITTSGVSYSSSTKSATLTISPALTASPADLADLTFSNTSDLIECLISFDQTSIVHRNGDLFVASAGSAWTHVNVPEHGSVVAVDGAGQTGTSLTIDGLLTTPQQYDTFTISGVEKVYTITTGVTVTSGGATLTITPALASTPADNAVITFVGADRSTALKHRHTRHSFAGTATLVVVDGANKPFTYDGTTFTVLGDCPSDVIAAEHVVEFNKHIFFAKGTKLSFTAPYTDDDFSAANGSGVLTLPSDITGLVVFRDQLIIFTRNQIHRLSGTTISDFQLNSVSQDIGCIYEDTIQEVGGDIVFVGPDGIRLLSGTERLNDFGMAVASRPIQSEATDLFKAHTSFASCTIRSKSQYRVFGYASSVTVDAARGILGTQFADQTAQGMAWAELRGIRVYVVDSVYSKDEGTEIIVFAHSDGYVYRMESGNSFDGADILATFSTPFMAINDPRMRKTAYKLTTYLDTSGSVTGNASLKFDFDEPQVIQPTSVTIQNTAAAAAFYGTSTFGTAIYGGKLLTAFINQVVGSGFVISVQYTFQGDDPPFSLDAATLEIATNDRQ